MNLTIPILIEETPRSGQGAPVFKVAPLFDATISGQGEQLSRATARLAATLRRHLDQLGREMRHDALARWTFCPALTDQTFKRRITFRRGSADVRALVVSFEALGRRIAMMPALHGRWFEILRGQDVVERAGEVIVDHLDELHREAENFKVPDELTSGRRQRISALELDVTIDPQFAPPGQNLFALLGSPEKVSGREELQKVGRCLDWLYPDELDRAVLREPEVTELESLLAAKDRRPVLLLAPSRVGKTAVVHECVYRRVKARHTGTHVSRNNVWLLSPQRLISGMSYVGQWEGRVLAIVEEAIARNHVLYFDDILGLYFAGLSRDSDLTVAHVLKPYIERRDFRILGEMTPEAFRILQERDRGMADLFHVLPIRPTTQAQTVRVLISVARQLEGRYRCNFDLEVQPLAIELTERYQRELAQPGKSALLLREIAAKHAGKEVFRNTVLNAFGLSSGLLLGLLDSVVRIERTAVAKWFSGRISGQREAVEALADIISIAKARLNDPTRPLATLLFLGPTGVGKTQCAKALATYLFNDDKRMLRFDMNEYVDAMAVSRLNGDFRDPEGLLTSAIRRQPFAVVLFDEIEKAHPAVFDLLLQVLGEGRLTDALGRTADFGNAIIIMTSNLGSREAGASFGLRPADRSNREVYLAAAEKFFRPEFINRIDRIVPFESLSRGQIREIADRLIADVFRRDGLIHRRCVLHIEPAAMERVVDLGYHPELGARALKRCIERQLTQPLAARLAEMAPDTPAVIRLYTADDAVAAHVQPLVNAQRRPIVPETLDLDDWADVLDRIEDAIDRIAGEVEVGDAQGKLVQGTLSADHFRYLAIREYAEHLRRFVQRVDRIANAKSADRNKMRVQIQQKRGPRESLKLIGAHTRAWRELQATQDLQVHVSEVQADDNAFGGNLHDQLVELVHEAALLEAMSRDKKGQEDRCLLWLRAPAMDCREQIKHLAGWYGDLFAREYGFAATRLEQAGLSPDREAALLLEMPGIATIMAVEHGTHIFGPVTTRMAPIQAIVLPLGDQDPSHVLQSQHKQYAQWRAALAQGAAKPDDDPFPLGEVLRIYDATAVSADLRSGLATTGLPTADEMRKFILTQLPLPEELLE